MNRLPDVMTACRMLFAVLCIAVTGGAWAATPSAPSRHETPVGEAAPLHETMARGGPQAEGGAPSASQQERGKVIPFPPNVMLPMRVGVSLLVDGIGKINETANTFEGQLDLRYRWRDPRLAFDVSVAGSNRMEFEQEEAAAKLAQIWNPRITISNMVEKEARIAPSLIIHSDGNVELVQRIKATFETRFTFAAFPFDTQSLSVIMLSSKYDTNEITLIQDQADILASGLNQDVGVNGWTPQGLTFEASRFRAWNGESHHQMEARMKMKRTSNAILAAVFTPFLLTLLVPTITTFYVKSDVAPRLTAWGASILAMVALSFTFSVRYPWLGSDSLVSHLFTYGHTYQFISVLLTVTLFNPSIAERFHDKFILGEIASYLRWALPASFMGFLIFESMLTAYTW